MNINILKITAVMILATCICCKGPANGFTKAEMEIIDSSDSIMRVLTIDNPEDSAVLRTVSSDLSAEALRSDHYKRLAELMLATVTHPSQDGVGIAAPQVGINRRVVAVQRFDKEAVLPDGSEGCPFEVYPNIRIVSMSESLEPGPEGCLSVPDRRGEVMRAREIVIEYADVNRLDQGNYMVRETIYGFTAVIFQHEIDHLDGVLYIDRL
jgi:peptide deformylase